MRKQWLCVQTIWLGNDRASSDLTPFFLFFSEICASCWCLAGQGIQWADLWSTISWERGIWSVLRFTSLQVGLSTSFLALVRSKASLCHCFPLECVSRPLVRRGESSGAADQPFHHLLLHGLLTAATYCRLLTRLSRAAFSKEKTDCLSVQQPHNHFPIHPMLDQSGWAILDSSSEALSLLLRS